MTDPAVLHPTGAGEPAASVRPARLVPTTEARAGAVAMPAAPATRTPRGSRGRLAAWALGVAMISLSLSWFAAWALPVAAVALVLALAALVTRRPQRELAWWALGIGLAAVACSACWIAWALQEAAQTASR
jgi:apolipoprotein N-acyltransferase